MSTATDNFVRELIGLGVASLKAAKIGDILEGNVDFENIVVNGDLSVSASATVSAAGSAITDATDLTALVNNVTTVAASTGVQLPAVAIGTQVLVRNSGANALLVYPDVALIETIGVTDGAAVSLAATEVGIFAKVSATNWIGGVAVVF